MRRKSSLFPVRTFPLVFVFIHILSPSSFLAEEPDILKIAEERPLGSVVNGVPAKYGDPRLAAAVDAFADIPRPWTVPTIIKIFRQESSAWLRKRQAQIDKKSGHLWEGWDKESKRCGHLATLLAASRDPRAAVVLGDTLEIPHFPGRDRIIHGLYGYFLRDPRYHQLEEPRLPRVSTNLFPEKTRRVEQWWKINKEELKAQTEAK